MTRIAFLAVFVLALLTSIASAEVYPQEVRDAFMTECTESGGPAPVCTCVLLKMEQNITMEQLEKQDFTEETIVGWTTECMSSLAPPAE
ncbi:MAG: hypothetical protein AUK47_02970 [Deltaproteobacteria bacterium CG2_30_63_29]|nr:MAG: hypothetical protein AUK47_02970 [Deltaproteobacteria bacterium CG2_30_63_29]PJB35691.1 MAG: hypothetical protein CO108_25000 [Deltaproteobacteria bacterium CG_4_9_14_3_um_filter_63_12]